MQETGRAVELKQPSGIVLITINLGRRASCSVLESTLWNPPALGTDALKTPALTQLEKC